MKLAYILTSIFFGASIFASPTSEKWPKRRRSRGLSSEGFRSGGPIDVINSTTKYKNDVTTNNWAGAAYFSPPQGVPFESVAGVFTVPTVSGASSAVSIWVGIDGGTTVAVIQGGIDIFISDDGTVTYYYWTEWYPDDPVYYDPGIFSFTAGDILYISITVLQGSTSATFTITDKTTTASFTTDFSPSDPTFASTGQNAEWVVETLSPFALSNFGTVKFSPAVAQTNQAVDLSSATALSISDQNNNIIATGQITGQYSLQISYTGP